MIYILYIDYYNEKYSYFVLFYIYNLNTNIIMSMS